MVSLFSLDVVGLLIFVLHPSKMEATRNNVINIVNFVFTVCSVIPLFINGIGVAEKRSSFCHIKPPFFLRYKYLKLKIPYQF